MTNIIHTCDTCGHIGADVYDITTMAPYPVPSEYLCDSCSEKRWEREQERLMEEG